MKKILLAITAVIVSMAANAQGIEIQKTTGTTTTTVASYTNTSTDKYKAVLKKEPSTDFNAAGHDYVEIGGLKWATMNIGAKTVAADAATCYGDYYAWGADKTWYTENTVTTDGEISNFRSDLYMSNYGYSLNNAPYYPGGVGKQYTKYTTTDGKTTLEPMDDIAHLAWGGTWRMPTSEDFENLFSACGGDGINWTAIIRSTDAVTKSQGVYYLSVEGCTVNSVKYNVVGALLVQDASHQIFFPATGYVAGSTLDKAGVNCHYWLSTLSGDDGAKEVELTASYAYGLSSWYRYMGLTVRPVSE